MSHTSRYDVIIIGSGLGGLLSAVLLAKEGMKVCVLEKNKQIGGCLQTFSLQKHVFDSCVHYVGGLGEGHTLNKILSYVNVMDKLELKAFDNKGFDRISFGEEENSYPLAIGSENFVEQLLPYFPKEKEALQNYTALLKETGDHFPLYRLRVGDANEKAVVSGWKLTEILSKLTDNVLLQNVLLGNNLLYAGVKQKTPFYLHALVSESYIHSAHKIVPGSSQLSKFLWKELQEYGGEIYRNTEVTKIAEVNGAIEYVETKEGQRFYGKQFIANIHPEVLLRLLDSKLIRPAYKNRIRGLQQTTSSFMLNLVLNPQSVPTRNHNIYWHQSKDSFKGIGYSEHSFPESFAVYFTESKEYAGFAESVSVLSYMNYDEVSQWKHTTNHSGAKEERGQAYEDFKNKKSELILEKIYQLVPELKGNILARSAATPLTFRDYTATPKGSMYGILKDVNKPAETTIATRSKIPNLLLTGQNVNLHGVLGVSITALATCAELIGMEYLIGKINNK